MRRPQLGGPLASRGISVSCPGLVHVVGTSPKRLRGVRGAVAGDVSFARVTAATRDLDARPRRRLAVLALRELSDFEAWRLVE